MSKIGFVLLGVSMSVQAVNTPCSGSKGGIAHCDGKQFVCQDGSISASKLDCSVIRKINLSVHDEQSIIECLFKHGIISPQLTGSDTNNLSDCYTNATRAFPVD